MTQTVITYDLAGGNASEPVTTVASHMDAQKVSFQLQGDGVVNGTVTVKLQESNVHGSGPKDVPSASGIANANTSEYIDAGELNSSFINFDVALGTATIGIITMTINYKQ